MVDPRRGVRQIVLIEDEMTMIFFQRLNVTPMVRRNAVS